VEANHKLSKREWSCIVGHDGWAEQDCTVCL
jgi:hypothetical protein